MVPPALSLPQLAPGGRGAIPAAAADNLRRLLRGEVRTTLHDRMLYATDASSYQVEPLAVVVPANAQDVVAAVRFAHDHGLPILPRGGGTSLAGQCTNRAIVLDVSAHLTAMRNIDTDRRRCTAEAGLTLDDLNAQLAATGLFFAPDPSTSRQANVGGCIGNNAAGARSVLYGRTSENVAAIDACLADGTPTRFEAGATDPAARRIASGVLDVARRHRQLIRERFPRTLRRNAGYALDLVLDDLECAERQGRDPLDAVNLARLLCGSEGTLAVTLAADLILHEKPRATGLLLLGFNDLDAAIAAVGSLLETQPSAIELVDDVVIDLAMANRQHRRSAEAMPPPATGSLRGVLYVEYFAQSIDELEAKLAEGEGVARASDPAVGAQRVSDPAAVGRAWALRKAGEPLLHGVPSDRKPVSFVEDNAVPVERLGEWVRRFRAIVRKHGTYASFYAHASVGVLHVRPMLDPRDPGDERRMTDIAVEVADLAQELGGVMSGEHGDGRVRGPLLERFYGPELMRAFAEVKAIFDPAGLLNPGNIVGAPVDIGTMLERTRIRPREDEVDVAGVETYFDYQDQHGFRGAVEMCNGAGVCRKRSGGVMCPSYMATLDERHSTRGRGNALRLATTGQLTGGDESPWSDPGTIETLNLCLSCKACKSECPSNVDIARLKAEYTAQRFRERGRPSLQALAFGNIRLLNRMGALAPGLANTLSGSPLMRWLLGALLRVDRRRSLPRFSTSLARLWKRARLDAPAEGPRIAVFGDCFTMFNEPRIGLAAARVLGAFGYRPVLIDAGCCGRPQISMGMLDAAQATLARTFAALEAADAEAIVVLEPSCLSAIRDDWVQLRSAVPIERRRSLASRCHTLEGFLEAGWGEHPRRPEFAESSAEILMHGHCHERSLWGSDAGRALLGRLGAVRTTDATCCGMAGSFGFTTDRYELSMKIGELGALPEARAAAGPVVAAGTSCRHQMLDGAGVHALHPAEVLADALDGARHEAASRDARAAPM
ncbi:MAG: FAD-linked oxidase C-terminal domain-containing protein [Planctomycetota bacterium]